jgi:hypothetical protein
MSTPRHSVRDKPMRAGWPPRPARRQLEEAGVLPEGELHLALLREILSLTRQIVTAIRPVYDHYGTAEVRKRVDIPIGPLPSRRGRTYNYDHPYMPAEEPAAAWWPAPKALKAPKAG